MIATITVITEKKSSAIIWKPLSSDHWDRSFYISAIVVAAIAAISKEWFHMIAAIAEVFLLFSAITAITAIIWKPGFYLIMACFKRKDCLQRNLCLFKASDTVWSVSISAVIWSNVLISVTWVELLWAVYMFFRINNIDLKYSFVRCRKYHKSWWNGAAELHISVELLCWTTAAELHNSVDLLCGTTAAETFERWTFWKIQPTQIDSRPSANSWNMYALRRFSKLLKDERFTKTE